MKAILTGASGLIGQGVLIECLSDPRVETVLSLGRSPSGASDAKLTEIVHPDLFALSTLEDRLRGYDACFYCAGAGVIGSSLDDYRRITYDMTLHVAQTLARVQPGMMFVYVSGAGSDSHNPLPWFRIKGEIEQALQALPLRTVLFRAGGVQPVAGVRSRHAWLQSLYTLGAPGLSFAARHLPSTFTTTECMGRAMIAVAAQSAPPAVLTNAQINRLGGSEDSDVSTGA
ncbi:MAG: NAD-dependent epimerase/dehydratase family protein [Luteimonas sp.]